MDKLKPCPFCGYKADTMFYKPFDGYQGEPTICRIWCLNCKAQIERDTFIKAMVSWNMRADTKEIDFDYEAEDGQ
jgi:Lar family restriction alleviation protein